MHEWMLDNGFTPHLVVDAKRDGVRVPEAHVKDGKIVLNVSPSATRALSLGNEFVSFEARFGGVSQQLVVPIAAVLGIYARETGQGMIFGDDDSPRLRRPRRRERRPTAAAAASGGRRPKLKVDQVKRAAVSGVRAAPRRSSRRGSGSSSRCTSWMRQVRSAGTRISMSPSPSDAGDRAAVAPR